MRRKISNPKSQISNIYNNFKLLVIGHWSLVIPAKQAGFTFIELIIVFTVTTILGTVGIASLASYNQSQVVATTALDLKTLFQEARSKAISQVKPESCPTDLTNGGNNSTLLGYEVDFCVGNSGRPLGCRSSSGTKDYEVNAECATGYVAVASKTYSSKISISSQNGYKSYFFPVISAGVNHNDKVTVSGYGRSQSITITSLGVIE